VQTLAERDDALSPEQRDDLWRMLWQQSQRLAELVDNLLDLSRLEADSIRIAPVALDVRERLAALAATVVSDRREVSLAVPDGLGAVVDPQAFDRIVSNLLANAVRHGAPPFRVSAARSNGEFWVTIEDAGPGVAPEFVGSLFERFTRGATASTGGAGLGLSIAQTYARAHGGSLRYEPVEPHGARFRLMLPTD
jgi:two-component system sensor histidine kinase MtrB